MSPVANNTTEAEIEAMVHSGIVEWEDRGGPLEPILVRHLAAAEPLIRERIALEVEASARAYRRAAHGVGSIGERIYRHAARIVRGND